MSFKELPLPSIASLRAAAALKSTHLAIVRPARIGLGFESASVNQRTLAEVEHALGGPGRLSLPYSLRWLLDAMSGLGVLHRALGFVHGELQPEHLVLGEDGIGRLTPVVRAHWVRGEQRVAESLYYLAPEKLLGDGIDARSDVFSAGVMLWEAVAGQRLLEAYTVEDVIARLMSGGIPRARAPEGEGWTAPLALIAERAISVDPARRYPAIGEMRDAIEHASARYLASTPGMVALFQHPEQRVRGRPRDSFAPESQRATMPPGTVQPLAPAAHRLSRPHLSSVDLEEELTRPKGALTGREAASIARPKPSATISNKSSLVDTLVGVQASPVGDRESGLSEELTRPFMRIPDSEPAPAVTQVSKPAPVRSAPPRVEPGTAATRSPVPPHNPTPPYFRSPVSSLPPEPIASAAPRPQPAPQAAAPTPTVAALGRRQTMSSWPPPISSAPPTNAPPAATSRAPAATNVPQQTISSWPPRPAPAATNEPQRTLAWPPVAAEPPRAAPLAASPRVYTHEAFDPSYELMRPRRSGTIILLVLGVAVAALGLFIVRPWLAQRAARESAVSAPVNAAEALTPPATPQRPATPPTAASDATPPPEPSATGPAGSAAPSTAPAARVASGRGRASREEPAFVPEVPAPAPAEPADSPEPAAAPEPTPTPEPEPPPPPPPPPKPKPASDADRYGI